MGSPFFVVGRLLHQLRWFVMTVRIAFFRLPETKTFIGCAFLPTTTPLGVDYLLIFKKISSYWAVGG
ncbi:MAG: hypothetical protein IJ143_02225 [Neisseriaceae bacterium]|nr:hypothetical protein [Neisseriaceae bacterium]